MFKWLKKKETTQTRSISTTGNFWNMFSNTPVSNYLSIGTVYSCIRMISDSIAMTDLKVYEKNENGREEKDGQLSNLLKNPAPNVTYFQWLNAMIGQLIGWGNSYSYIIRNNGKPNELVYIPSNRVTIYETLNSVEPYYYVVSLTNGTQLNVFPDDMIHFRNITLDGYTGLSPIKLHSTTFDRGYLEDEFATNFVKRAGSISGIITTDKGLKPAQIKQLKEDFQSAYGGASNAGKTPVLGDGMSYQQLKPISPADADYINSKKLTSNDIMQIFKVPPPLLGVTEATYSNVEELGLIYQRYTLNPIYTMIEQEMSLKLISSLNTKLYMEFMSDGLLNATAKDKAEVITKLTEKGVMTLNEARKKYNLKDIKELDEVVLPLNSAPLSLHKEVLTPVPPPPPVEAITPAIEETPNEVEDENKELRQLVHKLQSDVGRLKKGTLGNGTA